MADYKKYKVGITSKEPWASDITYEQLDYTLWRVEDGGDGCGYIALKNNIGVTPNADPTVWRKAAEAGQSIYDLAVKYHHFVGTEEEFEAQYRAALAAANNAAAAASATDAQVQAEEAARVNAESARDAAESGRATAETARQSAETARATAESGRASAETARATAETARATAEEGRASAETARETQASGDHARAEEDHTAAASDHTRAASDHTQAESDTSRAGTDHTTAASDHTTAASDHTQAGTDHSRAETDHTTAVSDHSAAESDHSRAEEDHTRAEADHESIAAKANTADLLNGSLVPAYSGDLESWVNQHNLTSYTHSEVADTAGGSASIMSDIAAPFEELIPTSRLAKATKIVATGKNLLRLVANGGIATAIGDGYYFPAPELKFGTYGVADENNGIIFTTSSGVITPTVRMKAVEDGAPTSVNDGVEATAVSGINGETFYVNPASLSGKAVYVIVSGIAQASTCAHIAWSGTGVAYDFYCSPTDASDAGSSIDLSASLTAIGNNGYLTLVGGRVDSIAYLSGTQLKSTRRNGRIQPTWTTTQDADNEGQYIHTAVISDMTNDGAAVFENSGVLLTVDGTTVSYSDSNSSATSDYDLYNLESEAASIQSLTSTELDIDDFGFIVLLGAAGALSLTLKYAVGIKDTLRQIASGEFGALQDNLDALSDEIERQEYQVPFEADFDYMPTLGGQPGILFCDGAPTVDNKPTNWKEFLEGGYNWTGLPNIEGQHVLDYTNHINYFGWRNPSTGLLEWKY